MKGPKPKQMALCTAPDRDVPALRCGYPLPCPHHTPEGNRIIRVVVLIEKPLRRTRTPSKHLVTPRIFGICLGSAWRAICAKFLS